MRDYDGLPGYDSWKLASPPEYDSGNDEPEYAEPVVSETWDGSAGRYVTQITYMSGARYFVTPYQSDYAIFGPNDFFRECETIEAGLAFLLDYEHWGW